MFEGIQRGLSEAFKKLRGQGRLTEANMREGLREVRTALLDADVNLNVADAFIQHLEKGRPERIRRTTAWDRWWVLAATFTLWTTAWSLRRNSGLV